MPWTMLWVYQKGPSKSRWERVSQMRTCYQWHLQVSGEAATRCSRRGPRGRCSSGPRSRTVSMASGRHQKVFLWVCTAAFLIPRVKASSSTLPAEGKSPPKRNTLSKINPSSLTSGGREGTSSMQWERRNLIFICLCSHLFFIKAFNHLSVTPERRTAMIGSLSPGPKIKSSVRKAEGMNSPWWGVSVTHYSGIPYPCYIGL